MVDPESPRTWTKEYVSGHRGDCLEFLREANLMGLRAVDEGNTLQAGILLNEILNGFIVMKNSGQYEDMQRYLSIYSGLVAELALFKEPEEVVREARSYGMRPKAGPAEIGEERRKVAIANFLDARDFATTGEMRSCMASIARELEAGAPIGRIRGNYFPDFPDDVRDCLLRADRQFFVPRLRRCAPDRCWRLDPHGLCFKRELDLGEKVPVDFTKGPDRGRSGGSARPARGPRRKNSPDFDQWMAENDYDEEDLEWMCRRVRRRKNVYGVLMLFPPLGVVLLPFWLRAVYLTRVFSGRDFGVDFNWFHKLVTVVYGLPTVYIYPTVMGFIVRWSEWGMGLRTARARALSVIALVLAAVLGFRALGGLEAVRKLPGAAAALPGRVIALVRGDNGGAEDPPPEEERGLIGGWYSVQLHAPPGTLEPDYMVYRYYLFAYDGSYEYGERSYQPSDAGLDGFQTKWSLIEADRNHGSYSLSEDGELYFLVGSPEYAEDELYYRCEYGGGLLKLWDEEEKCCYCYYATDADPGDEEMLITSLSEQSRRLQGEWVTACRTENNRIETLGYLFDGCFLHVNPCVHINSAYEPEIAELEGEQGWFVAPMGHEGYSGTYTFDGTNLVLTVLENEFADTGTWDGWTETYAVGGDLTETLELDGVKCVAIDEWPWDWEAVWDALGVDYSVD